MHIEEWKQQRRKEQRIARLKAVREREKEAAAELRQRAAAAKRVQERQCHDGMQAAWEAARQGKLAHATAQAESAAADEGRAHHDANFEAQRLQQSAIDSVTAWRKRLDVHTALHTTSMDRQHATRAQRTAAADSVRHLHDSVRQREQARSQSAVARHRRREESDALLLREAEARSRTRAIGFQRAAHPSSASASPPHDYRTTSFHTLLTSGATRGSSVPPPASASLSGSSSAASRGGAKRRLHQQHPQVLSYTADADVEAPAAALAVVEAEVRQQELKEEAAQAVLFAEREAVRAAEVRRGLVEVREEAVLEVEVEEAEKLERRDRQDRVVQESRLIEQQHAEMRRAAALDGMLRKEFHDTFLTGALPDAASAVVAPPTRGDDTRVLAARGASELRRAVSSSEVSQHLRELFELSAQAPPEPVALPQRTLGVAIPTREANPVCLVDPLPAPAALVVEEVVEQEEMGVEAEAGVEAAAVALEQEEVEAEVEAEVGGGVVSAQPVAGEPVGVAAEAVALPVTPVVDASASRQAPAELRVPQQEQPAAAEPEAVEPGDDASFEEVERYMESVASSPRVVADNALPPPQQQQQQAALEDAASEGGAFDNTLALADHYDAERDVSHSVSALEPTLPAADPAPTPAALPPAAAAVTTTTTTTTTPPSRVRVPASSNIRKVEGLQVDIAGLQERLNDLLSLCTTPPVVRTRPPQQQQQAPPAVEAVPREMHVSVSTADTSASWTSCASSTSFVSDASLSPEAQVTPSHTPSHSMTTVTTPPAGASPATVTSTTTTTTSDTLSPVPVLRLRRRVPVPGTEHALQAPVRAASHSPRIVDRGAGGMRRGVRLTPTAQRVAAPRGAQRKAGRAADAEGGWIQGGSALVGAPVAPWAEAPYHH